MAASPPRLRARRYLRAVLAVAVLVATALVPAPGRATVLLPIASWTVKEVPLPVADIAYDPLRDVLLVTVHPFDGALGNELVEVDPETGAIGRHVFLGSLPAPIALTDDGTFAYVGLLGVNRIVRVDLATFTASSFPTTDEAGSLVAEDLVTMPGRNDVVVASLSSGPPFLDHRWVGVYDDGVALPDRTAPPETGNRIERGGPTTVVAYNNRTSDFGIRTITVGATGATAADAVTSTIQGFDVDIEQAGGLVYSTSGKAVQPSTGEEVRSFAATGLVEVTPVNSRVTFFDDRKVSVFDTGGGGLVESRTFPALPTEALALEASTSGFAVGGDAGLFLLGPFVTGGPVALPPKPASTLGPVTAVDLPFDAGDLVYDGLRDRLYVSVRSGSSDRADQLLALDPATGQVLTSIPIGSDPNPLALTEDGTLLYVGLDAARRIATVDLDSFAVTGSFELGTSSWGNPLAAWDIEVQPGTADRLAVVVADPAISADGVIVYEGGVALPDRLRGHAAGQIEFLDATTLMGTAGLLISTSRMTVGPTGVSGQTPVSAGSGYDLRVGGGLVYGVTGRAFDPATSEVVGRYPRGGIPEPVPSADRVFVGWSGGLEEYELARFRRVASWPLDLQMNSPSAVVRTPAGVALVHGDRMKLLIAVAATPPVAARVTTAQHSLASDGSTWVPLDAADPVNVTTRVVPAADSKVLVSGNADLWTYTTGFNQDLAIFMRVNGGPYTMVAWKESGGFAGTFSPNAASVQALVPVSLGSTYDFQLRWKANKGGTPTIAAGAGPVGGSFSPTSISTRLVPEAAAAVSTEQYTLAGSDGATWHPVDAADPNRLTARLYPAVTGTAMVSASADLWTWDAGFNQDLAVFMSDNGGPYAMLAWKESGGFAGTFSPNAAAVQARVPVVAGHTYDFRLYWKANRAGASQISAGAGPINGAFSPTSVIAFLTPPSRSHARVSTQQYTLAGSDGATWHPVDPADLTLPLPAPAQSCTAFVSASADLWTWDAGFNQDIALFVRHGTGPYTLAAWKESGGFAGTFSPNAAAVHAVVPLAPGQGSEVQLRWKANRGGASRISAGAGPAAGQFSPTSIVAFTPGCG